MDRIVVVGAGLAGLQSVLALRSLGYAGRLALVGAETHPPYDRPPLSKDVLSGRTEDVTLAADWAGLDVTLLLGRAATGLREGVLETTAGELGFDGLIIATGGVPRRLAGMAAGALSLRTIEDARALRSALRAGARVAVVGAGWIGAEVVTAAVAAGCEVTALEAGPAPLAGALPEELGRATARWWTQAGVDLRTRTAVTGWAPGQVELLGGERLVADVVVVGIGVRPATDWLAGTAVRRTAYGAVEVDAGLRTSVPGVHAVGDAAAWESARYRTRLHVEHWDNALRGPAVAAANLLGGQQVYDPVPYFWSEQFGRMLQYAGYPRAGERVVCRGDPHTDRNWSAFWVAGDGRGDRLVAAFTVDRPRELRQAQQLMATGRAVATAALADPDVPVRDAAA